MRVSVMIGALALLAGSPAAAAVTEAQAGGFALKHVAQVAAPPAKVWAALLDVGGWWASDHTYSGAARNLSLEARPGGCWCETLAGGGVEHARVVYLDAPKALRLEGAFGPLQATGGQGHLTFALVPKDGGTELTLDYVYGGYRPGGLQSFASAVDGVFGSQVARLKRAAEAR